MKKRILCYGDSNTWGYNPEDGTRYPDDVRWTGILQRELGSEYTVIEEGYNGRTTVHDDTVEARLSGLTYFGPCLESQTPLDLVIIMLGTNDLKTHFGVTPRVIARGLSQYFEMLQSTPKCGVKPKVLIVSPILIDESYKKNPFLNELLGEHAAEWSCRFREAYEELAKDYGAYFMDAAEYAETSKIDGLHMMADAHESLGYAFVKKVKEILGE